MAFEQLSAQHFETLSAIGGLAIISALLFAALQHVFRLRRELSAAKASAASHCILVQQLLAALQASSIRQQRQQLSCPSPSAQPSSNLAHSSAASGPSDVHTVKAAAAAPADTPLLLPQQDSATIAELTISQDGVESLRSPGSKVLIVEEGETEEAAELAALLQHDEEAEEAFDLIQQSPLRPIE